MIALEPSVASSAQSQLTKCFQTRPSCKHSGKRWSYSAMVPNMEVLNKLFKITEVGNKKEWKTKKIPLEDFQHITGWLSASVSGLLSNLAQDILMRSTDSVRVLGSDQPADHAPLEERRAELYCVGSVWSWVINVVVRRCYSPQ